MGRKKEKEQQLKWENTDRDAKNLEAYAEVGMVFYGTSQQSELGRRAMAPSQMCERYEVTRIRSGTPMVGTSTLKSILFSYGPLTVEPNEHHPMWQPVHMLWDGHFAGSKSRRKLNEAELLSLENTAAELKELRDKSRTGKRSWF